MKKLYLFLFLIIIPINVYAEDASNISNASTYKINDTVTKKLNDDNVKTNVTIKPDSKLSISSSNKISHVYITYEISAKRGTITTSNEEQELGVDGFLHEYIKLTVPSESLSITYNEDAKISEISLYGEGDLPKDVQVWKKESKTDLMIFSTHADDEQLFFSGVMPTYIDRGKKVHVVYLARHDIGSYYNPSRMHEQLNGLWALGVTDYPTFGLIPDAYSTSLDVAEKQMNDAGFTDDDVIKFDVREIRKYEPKVILGHDENGEYGHGQHRLNTFTLKSAVQKAEDPNYIVDDLKPVKIYKFYIHLYNPENYTILDYDTPLDSYNGKTAYEVSKEGYAKHLSQQYTWFTKWLNGKNNSYTSAKQISTYSPMYWGLYYSSVGEDVNKNDLFEHIPEDKKTDEDNNNKSKTNDNSKESSNKTKNNKCKNIILYSDYIVGGIAIIGSTLILIICGLRRKNKTTK